jgi:hypothetical protein
LNAATFANLGSNNVNVKGAGSIATDPNINALVKALRGLEYQDKVAEDIDLSVILAQFEDRNINEFGFPQKFDLNSGGDNVTTFTLTGINFTVNAAGDGFSMVATYTFETTALGFIPIRDGSGTVNFTYEYKVTRY